MNQPVPAGWYPDPLYPETYRWWDGAQWTQATHPVHDPVDDAPATGRRRRSTGLVIVVVCLVALLVLSRLAAGATIFLEQPGPNNDPPTMPASTAPSQASPTPQRSGPPAPEASGHYLEDRPRYEELLDVVDGTHERYGAAMADGSIFQFVPDTEEGLDYAQSFMALLTEQHEALTRAPEQSLVPGELDAFIAERIEQTEQLEEKFLAGDDLGHTVRVIREDGSAFEGSGGLPDDAAPAAEEFARSFVGRPDDDGSYAAAGDDLAEAFGLLVTHDFQSLHDGCAPEADVFDANAAYCSATPTLIYVNNEHPHYENMLHAPGYIDLIKHEISHHQINVTCQTVLPSVVGETSLEAVTNSYASRYLDADDDVLQGGDVPPEYITTEESARIAQLIGDEGRCQ